MDSFKKFISEYRGAIIGAFIAILILLTNHRFNISCYWYNCRKLCTKKQI